MEKRYYINKYTVATRPKSTVINLELEATKGRFGYPKVRVSVNNKIYFEDLVIKKNIEFTVKEINYRNILAIEMVDKLPKDTVVDNGQIIKDKTLKIIKVSLDGIDIKHYIYKGKQKPIYHYKNQGPKITIGDQLFFNGKWKLYYRNPVTLFLAEYHGKGQKINSFDKQKIKNMYLQKLNSLIK